MEGGLTVIDWGNPHISGLGIDVRTLIAD